MTGLVVARGLVNRINTSMTRKAIELAARSPRHVENSDRSDPLQGEYSQEMGTKIALQNKIILFFQIFPKIGPIWVGGPLGSRT